MRNMIECVWLTAAVCLILFTDKEQSRQFEYDNGGETER